MDMRTTAERTADVFELLAPAGDTEIFQAVIGAGADAVYVGGSAFGARAYAANFGTEELLSAIDFAHVHGRKVYLAVNTLLKNHELEQQLYGYLLPFYERGLDAVIVQDIGVLSFIRQAFPSLPIHASTQMTVTGTSGVRLMQELGAERIVMARELSLAEIGQIRKETGAQLEVFVHGALCYCYSGQCLFSSMLGGRSGNRGRCAQPCRLSYTVLDENRRERMKEFCWLSLKDLCGITDLNRLHEAGVYSLKIEGRMKKLSYAAGVVNDYRTYHDSFLYALADGKEPEAVSRKVPQKLSEYGSRNGFTDGYYSRHNGSDMVTLEKPGYEGQAEIVVPPLKRHASARLVLRAGEKARLFVQSGGVSVSVEGMEVMAAEKKPLDVREVIERMKKTGDTFFVIDEVAADMEGDVFLPNGALNRLRRDGTEALLRALTAPYRRSGKGRQTPPAPVFCRPASAPDTVCLIENRSLLPAVVSSAAVTTVCLETAAYAGRDFLPALSSDVERCREAGKNVQLALPRIFRNATEKRYRNMAAQLRELSPDSVLVRNYEELFFVREHLPGLSLTADHSLPAYNDRAVHALAGLGASVNTVPFELNRAEISRRYNRNSVMTVYGRSPLMVSAQCVAARTGDCSKPVIRYLKDRYRAEFPVKNYCGDCYNVIYNSLPTMLFAELEELEKAKISRFRLDFTVESESQARQVLSLYEQFRSGERRRYPKEWQKNYTRGHYHRGVE